MGRIEYIKNQIQTIKALENYPEIPVVFIGRETDIQYAKYVKREAKKRGNVYFIHEIPHEELRYFYKKATVHVLPSLRESPGLVSLEALAYNCKIVVSDNRFCPTGTYFNDMASIANPLSKKDLRDKILHEIENSRDFAVIHQRLAHDFSWEKAAAETWAAYQKITKQTGHENTVFNAHRLGLDKTTSALYRGDVG